MRRMCPFTGLTARARRARSPGLAERLRGANPSSRPDLAEDEAAEGPQSVDVAVRA